MRKHQTILATASFALTLAAGIALAQGYKPPQLLGRPDPELKAARQSLDDALAHLQKSRNSESEEITRVRGYIEQAEAAIDPDFDSLAAPALSPNRQKP
jgi:hypothetical protein